MSNFLCMKMTWYLGDEKAQYGGAKISSLIQGPMNVPVLTDSTMIFPLRSAPLWLEIHFIMSYA